MPSGVRPKNLAEAGQKCEYYPKAGHTLLAVEKMVFALNGEKQDENYQLLENLLKKNRILNHVWCVESRDIG